LKHAAIIVGAVILAFIVNEKVLPADSKYRFPTALPVLDNLQSFAIIGAIVAGVMFALHKVGV